MREIVVITGSTGLIGSALARRLARSFDVVGLDSHPPEPIDPRCEHVHVDLTKDDSVHTALAYVRRAYASRLASFVHLAAHYDFSGEPSPLYENVTVRGTERLLKDLQDFDLEQFVFSSTMLVHAPCERGERIDERWPLLPKWDYPQSKVDTERLIHEKRGTVPTAVLRIAGVYDEHCHSVPLAHQMERIFERKLIGHVFPGDIQNGQAFVHLDDLLEAFALLIERRRELPVERALLIGEPETLSYAELQQAFGQLIHGEDWETTPIPKSVAKAGAWLQDQVPGEEPFIKPWMIDIADDHYALDISAARTQIGWEPRRGLRSSLPRLVDDLLADPVAWYRENKLQAPSWLDQVGPRTHREQRHAS
jgi:nucleoside-diphosphate-sugar epimerase